MKPDSLVVAIRELPLFQGLSDTNLAYVAECMERRSFRKGTSLFMRGESSHYVFIVEKGLVRVCDRRCPDNEVLIAYLGAGELLGEIHALDGDGHSADVLATIDTVCLCIEKKDFLYCLHAFPDLAFNLLTLTTKRLRNTSDRIALLSTQDTLGRLARQLEILASQCGIPTDNGGIEIPLPLSQDDLAALTGVSRQSINSAMQTFREQKTVECSRKHITILRPDRLKRNYR